MFHSGRYNVAEAEQSQHTVYADTMLCHVWLLDSTCVAFKVDKHCRGQALLDLTFDYLELLERDFFGLVFNPKQGKAENIPKWLDPTKKVRKQFSANSSFTFWFRVRFYVSDPIFLREEYTRYQFYLQVRKDILEGRLPVTKNIAAHLAGLALQSELGDFGVEDCRPGYVSQFRFIQQQTVEFESQASEWHRKSSSMLPSTAELEFLNIARQLDRYGVRTHEALDEQDAHSPVQIGVSFAGISVFRHGKTSYQLSWDNMVSIRFKGKKFIAQLKQPAATVLYSSGSSSALPRSPSTSTLMAASAKSISSNLVHMYRFGSIALVKSFWQYAVACHAFFRVREPVNHMDGISKSLSFRDSAETTSISATAVYAAISRATNGFRRFLSIAGRKSASTASLSGSVGGVGRTLSTVMELRRSSQALDRGLSRSSGRRSTKRSPFMSGTAVTNQQTSNRTAINSSLLNAHSITSVPTTLTTRTYSQAPPVVALSQPFARTPGSLSIKPSLTVLRNRNKKSPSPTTREIASGIVVNTAHTRSLTSTTDAKPSGSRTVSNGLAQINPIERQSRSRSSKSGSPVTHSVRHSMRRLQPPSSDTGALGETNSPRMSQSVSHVRPKDTQLRANQTQADDPLECSDQSDRDAVEFDPEEATTYWNARRAHTTIRPTRASSKCRGASIPAVMHESYHGRSDSSHDRPDMSCGTADRRIRAFEPAGSGEVDTGTGNTSRTHHFRLQPIKSSRKSFESNSALRKEINVQHGSSHWDSALDSTLPSSGSQFVRDPFHPGAPAGDNRDSGVDNDAELTEGLVHVRIRPDSHGRYGFNIRGGTDVGAPVIVSRVGQNMPADVCIPRLSEGDQLLAINGRTVTGCTHAEVINLIRSSKNDPTEVLELLVKQSDYVTDELNGEPLGPDSGDVPPLPPRTMQHSNRPLTFGRLSSRAHRHSLPVQNFTVLVGRSSHKETKSSPLAQSMLELEAGLSDGSLLSQFEQLPRRKPGFTTNAARLTENVFKNRYRDISPYDQTRVVLQRGTGDYINASFVIMDFPKFGFAVNYIAAQGPLLSTCGDFWQMCWEQQVTIIVMLTAVSERGRTKCHRYWPDLGQSFKFTTTTPAGPAGQRDLLDLQVQTVKEEVTGDFAFREFTLTQTVELESRSSNECRRVEQLQYISWPDHGIPNNVTELIGFVQRIREKRGKSSVPVVVHCSAGIGRTGVLIAMETAMNLMERGQPVRPIELVQLMRAQRALLIQTTSQFQFVCETILRVFQRQNCNKIQS